MRDTLTEGGEGALHLGPERARVFADLSAEQKDRYKADIRATNILLQEVCKGPTFDQLYAYMKQHEVHVMRTEMMMERMVRGRLLCEYNQGRPFQRNTARGNVVAGNAEGQNRDGNVNLGQAKPIMCYNCKGSGHRMECHIPKRPKDSDYFKRQDVLYECSVTNFDEDVDDLALNVDHVFEADQCDAFDSDVDEAPTTQTMFMVNLSLRINLRMKLGPSYDANTRLSYKIMYLCSSLENEYHESTRGVAQCVYVEESKYMIVQRNVSSVEMSDIDSILDEDANEQGVQSESANKQRTKIDEQMRIIISDRNRKETSLKSELHSAQLQLRSTLNHHKIVREEAIILKAIEKGLQIT
ncbi:hypothetical protein Tco_0970035 [Tanacetum coccineum]